MLPQLLALVLNPLSNCLCHLYCDILALLCSPLNLPDPQGIYGLLRSFQRYMKVFTHRLDSNKFKILNEDQIHLCTSSKANHSSGKSVSGDLG